MNRLLIYGASGHGKVIADIAKKGGYSDILFYDDDREKEQIGEYKILHDFPEGDFDAIIAVGDNKTRQILSEKLEDRLVTLIHPSAVVADDVTIGKGTVIMAQAVINPGTKIGKGVIINTCSSVDHDNVIEDFVHISVDAHTAGTVMIKNRTFIGIGASVTNNISISEDVIIGAGAAVVKDINEKGVYAGVPAKRIK